jgi:hypothetical protein
MANIDDRSPASWKHSCAIDFADIDRTNDATVAAFGSRRERHVDRARSALNKPGVIIDRSCLLVKASSGRVASGEPPRDRSRRYRPRSGSIAARVRQPTLARSSSRRALAHCRRCRIPSRAASRATRTTHQPAFGRPVLSPPSREGLLFSRRERHVDRARSALNKPGVIIDRSCVLVKAKIELGSRREPPRDRSRR